MSRQTQSGGCGGQQATTTVDRQSKVVGRTSGIAPTAPCATRQPRRPAANNAPPAPQITPAEAAARAIAKLRFTAAAAGMAPDHGDNGLRDDQTGRPMDNVVGYPVWLWADGGDTGTRSVVATEGALRVAITIEMDHIAWSMGDGTSLTCGVGTPWTHSVTPGANSPTCGHVYTRTGDYQPTATTHWVIIWTAGGQSGSVPIAISRSRAWAVGELQVIVQ